MQITLRCPAENRVVGIVTVRDGGCLDANAIRRGYEAERGYELGADTVKDGVQMLCPRCANPLAIPSDDADLYIVPGTIRVAQARSSDGANAR